MFSWRKMLLTAIENENRCARGEGYFKVTDGQRRLISVFYDEFLNNFQIWYPVHIAKVFTYPTGPWSLQKTMNRRDK